jgi:hypothetical protein
MQSKFYQKEKQTGSTGGYENQSNSSGFDNLVSTLSEISQLLVPSWLMTLINHDSDDYDQSVGSCKPRNSLFKFKRLSQVVTDMVVRCVVLVKQSPIPGKTAFYTFELLLIICILGLLRLIFSHFMHLVLWLEHQFNIMEKLQNIGIECIKVALLADEKYHLHEYASEALYSIVSTLLKSIVAYKDVSSSDYQDQKTLKAIHSKSMFPNNHL